MEGAPDTITWFTYAITVFRLPCWTGRDRLYVAAYFAFSTAKEADSVSIFALSNQPNRISGNKLATVYRYGPYVRTHRRHFLQQSESTLCLFYEDEWWFYFYDEVFDKGLHQQGQCRKFTIPISERLRVLSLLDEHNLNAFSLFGSEESMMETLAAREFLFDSTRLRHPSGCGLPT